MNSQTTIDKNISLPLSEAGKKTIFTKLSSDSYYNWLLSVLMPFDLLYTYFFRYGRVACNDMINAQHPGTTNDNGPMIDYTMVHTGVGSAVAISFISIAALSSYWEVDRQVKIKNNSSAKYIYDQLNAVFEDQRRAPLAAQEEKAAPAAANALDQTLDLNYYIKSSFEADAHLQRKYSDFQIVGDELRVILKANQPTPPPREERTINRATGQENPEQAPVHDEIISPRHDTQALPPVGPTVTTANRSFYETVTQGLYSFNKNIIQDVIINKIIYPTWQSAVLMSFVYWIEWIGEGIFTGNFNPWGVAGFPDVVAFGLPVLAGVIYPAIKIYNYFNNYSKENSVEPTPAEQADAEADMSVLLRRALARREFVVEKNALEAKLRPYGNPVNAPNGIANGDANGVANGNGNNAAVSQLDAEIFKLRNPNNAWKKPVLMLFSVATGSYVGAQYCTWIISSLANLLLGATAKATILAVAGWPLLIGAALYGCYEAYKTYQGVQEHYRDTANLEHQEEFVGLENELAQLQSLGADRVSHLSKKPPVDHLETQFFLDANRHGPSTWTRLNKFGARAFQFINGGCTGIFLARVFFVEHSAIALPFAAAALSYPVTIAVLAGIGIAYGAFKTYEYHQKRNDKYAVNLIKTRTERLECLRNEVTLARLRKDIYTAEINARVLPAPQNTGLGFINRWLDNRNRQQVAPTEVPVVTAAMNERSPTRLSA